MKYLYDSPQDMPNTINPPSAEVQEEDFLPIAREIWSIAYRLAIRERALAQPSAPQAQVSGVPSGWQVALVEPTEKMIIAGIDQWLGHGTQALTEKWRRCIVATWSAMLAASPSPAQQDGEVERLREAAECLLLAVTTRELRGRDDVPSMRDEQNARQNLRRVLDTALNPSSEERRG